MSFKKVYFGTNLKMYKGVADTVSYLKELKHLTSDIDRNDVELFVIPSYIALSEAVCCVSQEEILLGAQNMCWEEQGQFTGEISPLMLRELGLSIVELGHSERRHIFGESNDMINRKVYTALKNGFKMLLCIGETGEDKQYGISDEVLKIQLKTGFYGVSEKMCGQIMVAYEPVWAIGEDGEPASAEYAQEKHAIIRKTLCEIFGDNGYTIPLLYGGSVNPSNADNLILQPDIDGLFVGRSAWNAADFNSLIRSSINKVLLLR